MQPLNEHRRESDSAIEKRLIMVRLTASFLCIVLINTSDYNLNITYSNSLILLYLTYNLGLWAYACSKTDSRLFVGSVYLDILMISLLIVLRGGNQSDLYASYFIVLSYILSKRQKHLILTSTMLIFIFYPAACILFSDHEVFGPSEIYSALAVRISIMLMIVFVLFNIKSKMNHASMLSQKAYEMALIDPLTKVYNRNMLDTLYEYRRSNPYHISFAMIDIDDFKVINDTFGHQKGDKILSRLGELIKANIRSDDVCIRYGGEEFLLAFKNTDHETALHILDRIKSTFSEYIFYLEGKPIYCTISAGLALGAEDEDTEMLISYADSALYQAKRNGKNNIMTYYSAC